MATNRPDVATPLDEELGDGMERTVEPGDEMTEADLDEFDPVSVADAILAAATDPSGARRFYPPFEHPATARLREQQARLEAFPESEDRDKALDWTKEKIAMFEHGEDRAKADYLRAHRGR